MQTCDLSPMIKALPKGVGAGGGGGVPKNTARDKEIIWPVHRVGVLLMISCKIRLL